MKTTASKLIAGFLAAATLTSFAAQAQSFDRGPGRGGRGDDRGRGGYSRECQRANDKVRYCENEVRKYQDLYNGPTCRGNTACKYQQAQALQYTIQQLQNAQRDRDRACY